MSGRQLSGEDSPETCLGKTNERIEVPIVNERQKQTYYGALNFYTQAFWVKAYEKGNSDSTLAFLSDLQAECPNYRIALIGDGASYHRSQALKDYLNSVNQGLDESQWKITCLRFAPNDPTQNPVEDVWLLVLPIYSRVLSSV